MRKEPGPVGSEGLDEEVAAGADYDLARRRVRSIVEGPTLDDFLRRVTDYRNSTYPPEAKRVPKVRMKDEEKARIGHLFVAALNDPAREALPPPPGLGSTPTRLVRLSPETAVKQVLHHGDLTAADYRRIPDLIEDDRFQKTGDRKLSFFGYYDGRWHRAMVKQAKAADEIYLASYHKARPNQVPESIRKEREQPPED